MLGAIIGDMVGSVYEFSNTKSTDFPFFSERSNYTDDSIMTLAVAEWLLTDSQHTHESLERIMVRYAEGYPHPMGGYGGGFAQWLFCPERLVDYKTGEIPGRRVPYNSWGNGAAMRASAVGWMFDTLEETEAVAALSASITHDHPEGIRGAQATAAAIFLARTGMSKQEIKDYIEHRFGYDLSIPSDEIRKIYGWEDSCQGTVPPAIRAFLDSSDFESAIRIAVSLGGDSDTLACITGGIAEAFYGEIPDEIEDMALARLPEEFKCLLGRFAEGSFYKEKAPKSEPSAHVLPQVRRYTPSHIRSLESNEVFVFGSNLHGWHGGGAAAAAMRYFGAVWGQGVGMQGQCYAIPTMHGGVNEIRPYVDEFIDYAKQHPELIFYVTRIGCGIAGFRDEEIAPLFKGCEESDNIILPKSFHEALEQTDKKNDDREEFDLTRFHEAQENYYQTALAEIKDGYKRSHWMWFIFPQIKGLGKSSTAQYYAISNLEEARAYLADEVLASRIKEISEELLKHSGRSIKGMLGGVDSMKLRSSMTLFDMVSPNDVFCKVLDVFYFGKRDNRTIEIVNLPVE